MTISTIMILIVGITLLAASVNSRTAFMWLMTSAIVISFLMTFNVISLAFGVIATIMIAFAVIWLDNEGRLA